MVVLLIGLLADTIGKGEARPFLRVGRASLCCWLVVDWGSVFGLMADSRALGRRLSRFASHSGAKHPETGKRLRVDPREPKPRVTFVH